MVPETYFAYFTGAATAAGALIGLLFVAVSLRPESVFGSTSTVAGQQLALSAFTSLVNAFFLSLLALIPDLNLGHAAGVLALICLWSTYRTHTQRREQHWRLLILALAAYLTQLTAAIILTIDEHALNAVEVIAYVTIGSFSAALGRAWALVRGSHLEPEGDREG